LPRARINWEEEYTWTTHKQHEPTIRVSRSEAKNTHIMCKKIPKTARKIEKLYSLFLERRVTSLERLIRT
jgi:precorrin-6B methylase 1